MIENDEIIQFGYMTRLEMIELFGIKTGSLNISKTWTVVAFFCLDFDMPWCVGENTNTFYSNEKLDFVINVIIK